MSEDLENRDPAQQPTPEKPANPLANLLDIVNDLWGESLSDGLQRPDQAVPDQRPPRPEKKPEPEPVPEKKPEKETPAEPPFETFWRNADETVDWTDALAYAKPRDGLTSPELWRFFHERAEKVLSGDLPTYAEVLREAAPLADLRPYTDSCRIAVNSADKVTVTFIPAEGWLTAEPARLRRYLSGISLRCARDVMALLPIREVLVKAVEQGEVLLTVTFSRGDLRGARFGFIDPETFVRSCGGEFACPEE